MHMVSTRTLHTCSKGSVLLLLCYAAGLIVACNISKTSTTQQWTACDPPGDVSKKPLRKRMFSRTTAATSAHASDTDAPPPGCSCSAPSCGGHGM